ncbi:hypothetical protein K505DRAFT_244819 [Melanomma pulvis-pyrius CBS 109.77]|uniref:Uncharacterized protein n=1 Tax=Melanomma pulvis-pyrius CBS 109.77 TaxID=1314802 RepID=A0A6A6X9L9_9PLEO|nr:hypothetical protein K505DRAFT_244819 [Melanomma pulvis-pyrius CBS 109.77]
MLNRTFDEAAELIRGASNILPHTFYRVFYETSATLSSYVSRDIHANHRETPQLKLEEGNAFQALGKAAVRDLTNQRIERHLKWAQKKDPSSFISAFDNINDAKRRARFHYDKSRRIGQRICCAQISTSGLVPATVRTEVTETEKLTTKTLLGIKSVTVTETTRNVQIPIWVCKTAILDGRTEMSLQELILSGADVWLSITEIRVSDLRVPALKGHHYEWVAWGKIPKSCVQRVMPYDGKMLHRVEPPTIVYSFTSNEPWIFDYATEMWILDSRKAKLARTQRQSQEDVPIERESSKHALAHDEVRNKNDEKEQPSKRQKVQVDDIEDDDEDCCPTCGQKVP